MPRGWKLRLDVCQVACANGGLRSSATASTLRVFPYALHRIRVLLCIGMCRKDKNRRRLLHPQLLLALRRVGIPRHLGTPFHEAHGGDKRVEQAGVVPYAGLRAKAVVHLIGV